MRDILSGQGTLDFTPMDDETKEEFEKMDKILRSAKKVLHAVDADLLGEADPSKGRPGMSAQQVLRMALVKQLYGWSFRELRRRVEDSITLRRFCDYEFQHVHKFTTIATNVKKLTAETFELLNQELALFAKREGYEDGRQIRIDSTAVETDIHHPTDASLLWDAIRVVTRLLQAARRTFPGAAFTFHNRTRKSKKLFFEISNTNKAEKRKELYRQLLHIGREVFGYGTEAVHSLRKLPGTKDVQKAASIAAAEIKGYVDLLKQIIDQAHRRVVKGEKLTANEKIVSIFEPHTDIIEKGGRETIFGHKVCLTFGKSSLVLGCQIEEGNPFDSELFQPALDAHRQLFRVTPKAVATDSGFASTENALYANAQGVEQIHFGKRVAQKAMSLLVTGPLRRLLKRFRAGAEAIISALKRGVGLTRCVWKGWDSFKAYVWSAIGAHNLKMLTRMVPA
jgi:IS5 family transposase